jgi:hypothetical protein
MLTLAEEQTLLCEIHAEIARLMPGLSNYIHGRLVIFELQLKGTTPALSSIVEIHMIPAADGTFKWLPFISFNFSRAVLEESRRQITWKELYPDAVPQSFRDEFTDFCSRIFGIRAIRLASQ